MKKAFSLLFIALVISAVSVGLLSIDANAATSGTTGDCTWTLDDNGVLTISGNGKMADYNWEEKIPGPPDLDLYLDLPWEKNITEVIIEEGVTRIGDYSFNNCEQLTSITIPSSVTEIGDCILHKSNDVPYDIYLSNLKVWSEHDRGDLNSANLYLNGALLTNLVIPEGVTSVGKRAFLGCTSLTSVTLPEGITRIEDDAFSGCTNLNTAYITKNLQAFYEGGITCSTLLPHGGNIYLNGTLLTNLVIPEGVTSVGKRAFSGCTSLTSVTLPEGITRIEDDTFRGCTNLTSVTIPSSVTSIGSSAFYGCSSLKDVYLNAPKRTFVLSSVDMYIHHATWHYTSCDNHTFSAWKQTKAATCSTAGTEQRICSNCNQKETRDIPATHKFSEWVKTSSATCTAPGIEMRICSVCQKPETRETAALGHSFKNPTITKKPTCTETGIESGTCTRCKQTTTNTIPAKGHTYDKGVVTKEATETEPGSKTFTCSVCKSTKIEEIPVIGTEPKTDEIPETSETVPETSETAPETSKTTPETSDQAPKKEKKATSVVTIVIISVVSTIAVFGGAGTAAWYFLIYKKKVK